MQGIRRFRSLGLVGGLCQDPAEPAHRPAMLLAVLNASQLILYIALLALVGQGALHVLAGRQRDSNVFYRLLERVTRPFTWPARRWKPGREGLVLVLTFCVLALAYAGVTAHKIRHCLTIGIEHCR